MHLTRMFVLTVVAVLACLSAFPAAAAALKLQPAQLAQAFTSLFLLTDDNRIAVIDSSLPGAPVTPLAVSGLAAGDKLVAIDVRPQNGRLYGLGSNDAAGTVQLYHISTASGVAFALGPSGQFVAADGTTVVPVGAARFGLDFNPTVDRARVVTSGGLNFRMNPNSGAFVDGNMVAPGIQTDGNINPTTGADETAYTNSAPNVTLTTQYTLNSGTNQLYIQNPPNAGTQTAGLPITLQGVAVDFTSANGFDIPPGVDVAAANTPATGAAFAALEVGGAVQLHRIELSTGAATLLGAPGGLTVRGLAVNMALPIANALSGDAANLLRLRLDAPGTVVSAAISGVAAGETLVGIDGRPATGQLYGLGVNAAANTGTLYLIDPQTGAATAVGTPGQIAYVTAAGAAVDLLPAESGYGVDFNPLVDRLRVVTNSGLNFRINQFTGAPVDGDAAAPGANPDGAVNGLPSGSTGVSATAYTNAFAGTTVTTQYTVDPIGRRLYIQNPPNAGTQTAGLPITSKGAALELTAVNGFDIPPGVNAATSNAPASGSAYAALTVGGVTGIYKISLASGEATALGSLGTGATGAAGFVVWSEMAATNRIALPLVTR